ncbi:hypothetical protein [Haemophilus haemolyticus]|uniref:hypothetical protein n=1 Tax=Haemophilus haemolyticus TaxID=726 RepID=UPI001864ADD6|nr:hypothetical protein [Haemophilus haemolyticus]
MTKYNQSFKQQVFNFYLQHSKLVFHPKHFQFPEQTLNRWSKQFKCNNSMVVSF